MSDLYKELGLDIKGQKYRFVDDDVDLAEDTDFLPLNEKQNVKMDSLKENLEGNLDLNEKEEAEMRGSHRQVM